MYRVWYFQNGEWHMEACGKLSDFAIKLFEAYAGVNPAQYRPYLEWRRIEENT